MAFKSSSHQARQSNRSKLRGFRLHGETLEPREMLTFDPSGFEQAYLESINRTRTDPQGELSVLFSNPNALTARDAATQGAIDFFNVDANTLLSQWSELTPVAPVAWNESLSTVALAHTNLMAAFDEQSHELPGEAGLGDRIRAEGYSLQRATENVYAFAENHIHGHAGFIVDWGNGPGGIQDPAGHRDNYLDPGVNEVGISVVSENIGSTDVGPFLVTQNFARRGGYEPQVLGVVYNDSNRNGIYDPGEGLDDVGITVTGSEGVFRTTTMTAGGYQIAVPDGTYEVIATGGGLSGSFVVGNVVMNGENVKADFESTSSARAPLAVNDSVTLNEDATTTFLVTPNDVARNGAIVNNSVNIIRGATNGTASVNDSGRVTYIPNPNFSGNDSFTYTVRDTSRATSNIASVSLRVNGSSDPPVLSNSFVNSLSVPENGSGSIELASAVTDPDNDLNWTSLTVTTNPTNGSAVVNVAARRIVYTPNAGYTGSDSLSFQVSDSSGQSLAPTAVAITVTTVNDRPVAVDDVFTAVDRPTATLSILTNDSDSDGTLAAVQILTPPATGAVVLSNGNLVFTGPAGFVGAVEVRYRVQDQDGAFSDPATVTLYSLSTQGATLQNPRNRFDVNGDGQVAPIDALAVINALNGTFTTPAPGVTRGATLFVDVTGNQDVSPLDALQVINELNSAAATVASVDPTNPANAALSVNVEVADDLFADEDDEESQSTAASFWN